MDNVDNVLSGNVVEDIVVSQLQNSSKKEFWKIYETNREALLSYKLWRNEKLLPPFEELPIIPVFVGDDKYTYYEKSRKKIRNSLRIHRTRCVQKTFFQNLDKPLLVQNEMNVFHWEYLYDNVRKSEDYGGDNHIYLSYDDINVFLLLLCVEDITEYLHMEKIIFLFGNEKETDYPMDFLRWFGIDYADAQPKGVRVQEVQRLFVDLAKLACSGNSFFMGMLDYHKDIISVKGFELADYVFIYRNVLCDKTVLEFEKIFFDKSMEELSLKSFSRLFDGSIYGDACHCPTEKQFFSSLKQLFEKDYKPNEIEWFKGIFLAYAIALGRKFTGRISPAIKFETHFLVLFPEEYKRWLYNDNLFDSFKYCKAILPMRYSITAQSSMVDKWVREKNARFNYFESIVLVLMGEWRIKMIYYQPQKMTYNITICRFEDFKMYPKASVLSLCKYLDIPWDDMLMKITANGTEYMAFGTGAFDPTPLKKRYYNVCNPFDYYRIELVMSKYWKHFGYEPLFYKGDDIYTEEEILKMFELPFQCEQYITDEKEKARIPAIRKQMYELVKKRLREGDAPLDENGEKMIPIPWLKPKMEYVDGELYH